MFWPTYWRVHTLKTKTLWVVNFCPGSCWDTLSTYSFVSSPSTCEGTFPTGKVVTSRKKFSKETFGSCKRSTRQTRGKRPCWQETSPTFAQSFSCFPVVQVCFNTSYIWKCHHFHQNLFKNFLPSNVVLNCCCGDLVNGHGSRNPFASAPEVTPEIEFQIWPKYFTMKTEKKNFNMFFILVELSAADCHIILCVNSQKELEGTRFDEVHWRAQCTSIQKTKKDGGLFECVMFGW